MASSSEHQANQQLLSQLSALGIDSIHIHEGVQRDELLAVAEFLWQYTESGDSMAAQLAARNVQHISLGRLLPLDTRWRAQQWADAPTGPLDPDYAESLMMAQKTWEDTASGKPLDVVTVRDLVQLLIYKVARSNAALGQILAVKQYENLTYCHSVNVAMLSLLLGKQVGLDEPTLAALVEAALLHDVGKTQIPLDIVRKPGALDKSERADDRGAHDAGRRDPDPDRRAASAHADRGARASSRREGHRVSGSRRGHPAPDEPDRLGRRHLRGHHRRANLPGADAARTRLPDPGAHGGREAEHRSGEEVRQHHHVLPGRLAGAHEQE